jgi:hypothetical protein
VSANHRTSGQGKIRPGHVESRQDAEQNELRKRPPPEEFLHLINDDRVCRLAVSNWALQRFWSEP